MNERRDRIAARADRWIVRLPGPSPTHTREGRNLMRIVSWFAIGTVAGLVASLILGARGGPRSRRI